MELRIIAPLVNIISTRGVIFMEEKQSLAKKNGNLIIENRQKLTVTAIYDVESFSGEKIVLLTEDGTLTVTGKDMHIKKLSAESKDAVIEGKIDGCVYSDGKRSNESFFKRVLK